MCILNIQNYSVEISLSKTKESDILFQKSNFLNYHFHHRMLLKQYIDMGCTEITLKWTLFVDKLNKLVSLFIFWCLNYHSLRSLDRSLTWSSDKMCYLFQLVRSSLNCPKLAESMSVKAAAVLSRVDMWLQTTLKDTPLPRLINLLLGQMSKYFV